MISVVTDKAVYCDKLTGRQADCSRWVDARLRCKQCPLYMIAKRCKDK